MKIAILGCGVMGSAFARHWAKQRHQLFLCDRSPEKGGALASELGASFTQDLNQAAMDADWILLAIKPKDIEKLAQQFNGKEGQTLLSIVAGVSVSKLKFLFPKLRVVRTMPNLALIHGDSVIALVQDGEIDSANQAVISDLLKEMGMLIWVEEEKIDGITALAGSGPAFLIAILEAFIEGGVAMGLAAQEAKKIAIQMIRGALSLVEHQEGHPGRIRWKISAPKGTTIAGMRALERANIRSGLMETLLATYEKSKDIG